MKPMILGNNDPYDNEFKKEEDHNSKEMEKSVKCKDENASKFGSKADNDHGGGH